MPFIWDDIVWKFIDDEDHYDKSRFVVARKLHIKAQSIFTKDQIHRQLRKYGDIESIEILANKKNEAYVTFTSDRNAYFVQLQHDYDREAKGNLFQIQPADSWMQPADIQDEPPTTTDVLQTSELYNLNEDCLLHIFQFLDLDSLVNLAEVCKLFHTLLHQHCFPRVRKFTVYNINDTYSMPLAKMRRTLICIGKHITDLKYTCNIYNDLNRAARFLSVLTQFIGPNIRRAQFLSSLICEDGQIYIIAPILRNLESLEIHDLNYDLNNDIDFSKLCPNLIELKLKINMRLIKCCKPWFRLQHLSVMNNEYLNTMTFQSFIESNRQIQTLAFDVFDAEVRLRSIADNLTTLQKLTMDSVDSSLGPWNFVHIGRLQHLTEINLLTLDYQHLRGIFDCLTTISNLKKISVHAYRPEDEDEEGEQDYERSLVDLAKNLPHLEEFSLRSVAIIEKTLIDFIECASQIGIIHIHWCHLIISNDLIMNVANLLRRCGRMCDRVLTMYLNPADLLGLHITRNDEIKSVLDLSCTCEHFGF